MYGHPCVYKIMYTKHNSSYKNESEVKSKLGNKADWVEVKVENNQVNTLSKQRK